MNEAATPADQAISNGPRTGYVIEVTENGSAFVSLSHPTTLSDKFLCHFMLDAKGHSVCVSPGDAVLVLVPSSHQEIGCILGKIGTYNPPDQQCVQIEAVKELSLKCGEASIKLRSDGKILSQGVDIASLAKRAQKIRGGSVHIN